MTDESHCHFKIKRIYSASSQTISLLHLCQQVLESPANLKAFESKVGQAWAKEIIIDYYSRSRTNILTAKQCEHVFSQDGGGLVAGAHGEDPHHHGQGEPHSRRAESVIGSLIIGTKITNTSTKTTITVRRVMSVMC